MAAGSDLRTGRIPNALTYLAIAAGLVWGLWPGAHPSVGARVVGLLVAFVPAFALFLVRSIGGGDVKLVGAVGAGIQRRCPGAEAPVAIGRLRIPEFRSV